jgi:hypothetical protein
MWRARHRTGPRWGQSTLLTSECPCPTTRCGRIACCIRARQQLQLRSGAKSDVTSKSGAACTCCRHRAPAGCTSSTWFMQMFTMLRVTCSYESSPLFAPVDEGNTRVSPQPELILLKQRRTIRCCQSCRSPWMSPRNAPRPEVDIYAMDTSPPLVCLPPHALLYTFAADDTRTEMHDSALQLPGC